MNNVGDDGVREILDAIDAFERLVKLLDDAESLLRE